MQNVLTYPCNFVSATTPPTVLSDGQVLFKVNGDIQIVALSSECYSANDATATRITYQSLSEHGITTPFSGQSGSLASATVGTVVALDNTTLNSAPTTNVSGVCLGIDARGIRIPHGQIKLSVSGGSSTGLWKHYIRYLPLEPGASVTLS